MVLLRFITHVVGLSAARNQDHKQVFRVPEQAPLTSALETDDERTRRLGQKNIYQRFVVFWPKLSHQLDRSAWTCRKSSCRHDPQIMISKITYSLATYTHQNQIHKCLKSAEWKELR